MKAAPFLKRTPGPWCICLLASGLILAAIDQVAAQGGRFNVDALVAVTPEPTTFLTIDDASGCPSDFAGKFTFSARLANNSDSPGLPGVGMVVNSLTNGNVLLDPATNNPLGATGAVVPIPRIGQYADGLLSAGEAVNMPFVVCLRTREPFEFFVDVFGVVTRLVSVNRTGTTGNFPHFSRTRFRPTDISADGRFVVFESTASDLVATDTNGTLDVFVRDLHKGITTLVSVNGAGTDSGNGQSSYPVLTPDGRFVAFSSSATDLVTSDTNGRADVFVHDLHTQKTFLVSVNRFGTDSGNGWSGDGPTFEISADGRLVAFVSDASDLVAMDTNRSHDVFVRDLQAGTTTLVSVNRTGMDSGNRQSHSTLTLTPDGRFVVFSSEASDLVPRDTNEARDVFVRDLQTATTVLVSVNRGGTDGGDRSSFTSTNASVTTDGRFVVFSSGATDLVATDTNGEGDVFVRDLQSGITTLVSVNRMGVDSGNRFSSFARITPGGRFVLFGGLASDLVTTPDTNASTDALGVPEERGADVFVRDLQNGITTLVSINLAGTSSGNARSGAASMSSDGRFVAFSSLASDLVENDLAPPPGQSPFGFGDVFVRDLHTARTILVSVDRSGTTSGNVSSWSTGSSAISADGRFVLFTSPASNLVASDTNGGDDVFVRPIQH